MATPSARPLLLTVLGDAVLPTGGHAWLGALTRAMETVGVSAQSTRQALRRLAGQDLVTAERHGRLAAYRLSGPGRRRLEEAAERIYLRRELRWDGRWRLLTYTFPEEHRSARDALRRELAWLGYGWLGSGLWVSPWDHGTRLDAVLAKHGVEGAVETFTSELEGDDRELAARAWDLAELRAEHRAFVDDVEPELAGPTPTSTTRRRSGDERCWCTAGASSSSSIRACRRSCCPTTGSATVPPPRSSTSTGASSPAAGGTGSAAASRPTPTAASPRALAATSTP